MNLQEFLSDWLANSPMHPPVHACEWVNGNAGLTLYRDDRFQVQIWTFPPHTKVTDHSHPGLDTWLVWVSGKLRFRLDGKYVRLSETGRAEWRGMKTWTLHVPPGALHGATIGDSGASFLSITERIDGKEPESVHLIWDGPPLDHEHGNRLAEVNGT